MDLMDDLWFGAYTHAAKRLREMCVRNAASRDRFLFEIWSVTWEQIVAHTVPTPMAQKVIEAWRRMPPLEREQALDNQVYSFTKFKNLAIAALAEFAEDTQADRSN